MGTETLKKPNSRQLAKRVRLDVLEMIHASRASHIGSAYSCVDILAVLYSGAAKVFADRPRAPERDRIVLSKGHAGSAMYATLAECGFYPVGLLRSYCQNGSVLSGHVSHKDVPGVEFSTGSLGQGVCVACGMALSAKMRGETHHVWAIVGDGECEEGAVWEMAQFAAHWKLENFTVIVDHNRMQAMGNCDDYAGPQNLAAKWNVFGWNVVEVPDGNDHGQLKEALAMRATGRPTVVIANTVKGKGVSFMENSLLWHYRDPQGEFYERARAELTGDRPCATI